MKKLISVLLVFTLILPFACTAFAAKDFLPYPDSRFFDYGDYSIHYRIIPAKTTFKGRVLMLHGFLCSTYSWQNMAETLSAEGYECVLADLPNFGYSTRETDSMAIIDREELIKQLMLTIAPAEEWILAGHSMGGGVAINLAIELPVSALLLYCPCPQSEFPKWAEEICTSSIMKSTMNFFFENFTKITPLVRLVIYAATNDWEFAKKYDVSGVTAPVQYDDFGSGMCEMMYNVKPTDMADTGKITCPVLLCQAEKDIILTSSIKSQVNAAFPSAETYTVLGGGHQCIENRAEELTAVTVHFLSEQN